MLEEIESEKKVVDVLRKKMSEEINKQKLSLQTEKQELKKLKEEIIQFSKEEKNKHLDDEIKEKFIEIDKKYSLVMDSTVKINQFKELEKTVNNTISRYEFNMRTNDFVRKSEFNQKTIELMNGLKVVNDKTISRSEFVRKSEFNQKTEELSNQIKEIRNKTVSKDTHLKSISDFVTKNEIYNIIADEKNLAMNETKQLLEWTNKKYAEVIYDTDRDGYPKDETTTFGETIMNRNDLIFIVEDYDGNKFGEYLHSKITAWDTTIADSNAFMFSLKSNGRLNGMMKFEIINTSCAFVLYNDCDVFYMGSRYVRIYKQNDRSKSYADNQGCFNFHGLTNSLVGKTGSSNPFTPKRITVIQMN